MIETINQNWRPHKKSSNALLATGYSQEQLNNIGKQFIERYWGQEMSDASSKFSNMVRSSGSGHNVKPKASGAKEALKQRKADLETKSENGAERAVEVKKMSGDDLALKMDKANLIKKRWPHNPMSMNYAAVGITDEELK